MKRLERGSVARLLLSRRLTHLKADTEERGGGGAPYWRNGRIFYL